MSTALAGLCLGPHGDRSHDLDGNVVVGIPRLIDDGVEYRDVSYDVEEDDYEDAEHRAHDVIQHEELVEVARIHGVEEGFLGFR
ncbi:caspase recruitment domain-containing 6 isoform X1, putative [Babesia ovata]|uniref:Caspase recruitment domain-containing 6 isoform X1, putative n=1 Tax=Babesia ovata TaxID=189622 RepID=A0A2H6KDR4_9APIC|nr:caspase recruitment domain-containing 6 isoform X1, putative [Babesia ovata]GBE61138.1 caspase recruitment domain-containing 6 isoform X1, putative [Babesia ovata]